MDRFGSLNWSNGMKAKTTGGNVQHDGAVIGIEVDVDEPIQYGP
jgi:hypothetical protein